MDEDSFPCLEAGGRVGDLEIQERIGTGAFATVYRAHDRLLRRDVALKVLDPHRVSQAEEARELVLREARIIVRLTGPHVVTLHKVHPLPDGLWAYEMEYMGGGDLTSRLREDGTLPHEEVLRVGRSLLSALQDAHAHGVVHHDVKPANVLLTEAGVVKLSDFGLGRLTQDDALEESVARGPRGTPRFMAPEVVMGRPATPVADLWSLGVLLYELVTGRPPFPGRSIELLFHQIQNEAPLALGPDVPPSLAEAILACLRKKLEDRPSSADAVLAILDGDERARAPFPQRAVSPSAATAPTVVGRSEEQEALSRLLTSCAEGRGRFVVLQGEAGIGKTALLRDLAGRAVQAGFHVLQLHMGELEGLRRPLLTALQDVVDGPAGPSGSESSGPEPFSSEVHRQLLALGATAESRPALDVDWAFVRALRELAQDRPTLVVVEDAHVGRREDLQLLLSLATRLEALPLLFAASFRTRDPTSSDAWQDAEVGLHGLLTLPHATAIELSPLEADTLSALIAGRFGLTDIPNRVLERVQRKSEGVPLYALEFFRHLLDSGELARDGESVVSTERWGTSDLPRHIREMVRRRMAGLAEEDRELLEAAAVGGVEFDGRGLAEVQEQKLIPLLRALQRLYRERGLLRPTEQGFRFDHGLFRDVLYADLAPEFRRALHEQWALCLDAQDPAVDPETLGWHWEQAGRSDRARGPLLAACQRAMDRLEATRAWDLALRAGVLDEGVADETLREHARTLLRLSPAFNTPEEADRVEALYDRLDAVAARLADPELARRVTIESSYHRLYRRGAESVDAAAVEEATDAVCDLESKGDGLRLLGTLARLDARLDDARRLLERADACYEEAGTPFSRTAVLASLAAVRRVAGDFPEAERLYEQAAMLHAEMGSMSRAAINRLMGLLTRAQSGRIEGTPEAMTPLLEELTRCGQAARAAHMQALQGELFAVQGRRDEARALYDHSRSVLEDGALGDALLALRLVETRFHLEAGALTDAARELDAVHQQLAKEEPITRPDVVLLDAYLHAARGERAEASKIVRERLETQDEVSQPLYTARLLQQLARLAWLGVDLTFLGDLPDAVDTGGRPAPPFLALARTLFLAASRRPGDGDALSLWREARRLTQEITPPWFPGEARLLGMLLGAKAAQAHRDVAAAIAGLRDAMDEARRLGLVWYELSALRALERAGDGAAVGRMEEIAAELREWNPEDARLVDRLRERGILPASG